MGQYLKFAAALIAIFAIVPGVVLISTGSWRQTWEALRGYGIVIGLVIGIPMVIGVVFVYGALALGFTG